MVAHILRSTLYARYDICLHVRAYSVQFMFAGEKEKEKETYGERQRNYHLSLDNEQKQNEQKRKARSSSLKIFTVIAIAVVAIVAVSSRLVYFFLVMSYARLAQIHLYRWAYRVYRKDLRPMM